MMDNSQVNNTTIVYLPFSMWVNVHVFTNARFQQRVTIAPEGGKPIAFTGSGEQDHPIGQTGIQTPASGKQSLGFPVAVTVESNHGGTWAPSAVAQSPPCLGWYYNLVMVVSEDYEDGDWNDSVALLTWWLPPKQRTVPEAMRSKSSGA